MPVYIDTRFGNPGELDKVALIARRLGYRVICVEGLSRSIAHNGILFIPRKTSNNINDLLRTKHHVLKVYLVSSPNDLKSYPKLRSIVALVCLSSKAFSVLTPKHVERLITLGLPIELAIRDVYKVVNEGRNLKGLDYLVSAVESGRLRLIACSGASTYLELLHPKVITSTLIELGVDEVNALKAVTSTPAKVIRGLRHGGR